MRTSESIHVEVRCDFCGMHNELTAKDVADSQILHCSHCGGVLGDLGHLRDQQAEAPKLASRK